MILYKQFINPFLSFIMFNTFEKIYMTKYNKSLSRNITCLTHALGSVFLNLYSNNTLFNYAKNFSTGYFLYDTVFSLRFEKMNTLRLIYIYHHISSIYFLYQNPKYYYNDKILFWAELSNIPSYFVYHYLHKKPKNIRLVNKWLTRQKYMYSSIRIPILGYYLLKLLREAPNKYKLIPIIPVYLMGIGWTAKILQKK